MKGMANSAFLTSLLLFLLCVCLIGCSRRGVHACGPVCWTLTPQPSQPCIRSCAKRQGPARQGSQADIAGERCAPSFLGNIQRLGLSSGSTTRAAQSVQGCQTESRAVISDLNSDLRVLGSLSSLGRLDAPPRALELQEPSGAARGRCSPAGPACPGLVRGASDPPRALPSAHSEEPAQNLLSFCQNKVWRRVWMRCTVAASCYSLIHFYLGLGKKVDLRSIEIPNKMNQKQHICLSLSASLASCSFCKETISWMSCPRWFWYFLYFCTT